MTRFAFAQWLTLGSLLLAACAPQSTPTVDLTAEESAIRQKSEALEAAENGKQFDQATTFWAEDAFVHLPYTPVAKGHTAIRKAYDDFAAMGLEALDGTINEIVVAASGDLAWEHGVNRITFRTPTGTTVDVGKYLIVWKKVSDDWKVAAVAVSSDAPPPATAPPPTTTR